MPVENQLPLRLPLELRKRVHLLSAHYEKWILLAIFLFLALPFLLILGLSDGDTGARKALRKEFTDDFRLWIIVILVPLLGLYFWVTIRHERLFVTSEGFEYRSPLRGPLSFLRPLRPDWRLPWEAIESASIHKGVKIPKSRAWRRDLVLQVHDGANRKLHPYQWYLPPDAAGLGLGAIFHLRDERYLAAVEASPLYRVLEERGLLGTAPAAPSPTGALESSSRESFLKQYPGGSFNLASHPPTLALLAGLGAVGGYAIVDGLFLSPWRYLETPPIGPFVAAGTTGLVLASLLVRKAPQLERWALSLLLGIAAAGAVYPALLRVNAATDPDGARAYGYRQVRVAQFEPLDRPDMPRLEFTEGMEYWRSLPPGGEREFLLARGLSGSGSSTWTRSVRHSAPFTGSGFPAIESLPVFAALAAEEAGWYPVRRIRPEVRNVPGTSRPPAPSRHR